jgi:glycosyltransferase involved in cell wall biosynthesis
LRYFDFWNHPADRVKIIFVPCYLDGKDGVFNRHYYDMLIGNDLSVYPSYYEPWGYTPLESVAFQVPCVTTSLSGFGMWADAVKGSRSTITDGVEVVTRTDYNYSEVADAIAATVERYMTLPDKEVAAARKAAGKLSEKALWKHFMKYYHEAYDIALRNAKKRK